MNCENCTKYKGDCGHHAIDSNKHICYDARGKVPVTDMENAHSTSKVGVSFKYR